MVVGVWRDVVERLTPVPLAERQGFLTLPPTREAHAAAYASVAAFLQIERRQPTAPAGSAGAPRGTWNVASIPKRQRGLCNETTSISRRPHDPGADHGGSRDQRVPLERPQADAQQVAADQGRRARVVRDRVAVMRGFTPHPTKRRALGTHPFGLGLQRLRLCWGPGARHPGGFQGSALNATPSSAASARTGSTTRRERSVPRRSACRPPTGPTTAASRTASVRPAG